MNFKKKFDWEFIRKIYLKSIIFFNNGTTIYKCM
jgi:hypothetical protein